MTEPRSINGFVPLSSRRPATLNEWGDLIREAAASDQGLYPIGGGTSMELGLPPVKPGILVETCGLNRVIDYPARDMTITVEAGITLSELNRTLATEGQFLPVDIPLPERATLGGTMAANLSGARRLGRGTLRDYVIGIRFLTDEGLEVKAGGRVVKNVAGYDLMKLHVGALGTLGIITQVTLKVTPKPEDQAMIAFGVNAAAIGPTLDRLHASQSRPAAVELLNATAVRAVEAATSLSLPTSEPWVILAGFEEKTETVDWQITTLKQELASAPVRNLTEFRGPTADPLWQDLTNLQHQPESRLSFKVNGLPSGVANLVAEAAASFSDLIIHAHAGSGIVFGHITSPELTLEKAAEIVAKLGAKVSAPNGNLVVQRCPAEWKTVLPVWGIDRGERAVMRTIKATLDPKNIFNPGRMV